MLVYCNTTSRHEPYGRGTNGPSIGVYAAVLKTGDIQQCMAQTS